MNADPRDSKEALSKLFGAAEPDEERVSPFGDAPGGDPRSRLQASIVRLRHVRAQSGSDGLTPSATRSLLDELLKALEAIGEALPPGDSGASDGDGDVG